MYSHFSLGVICYTNLLSVACLDTCVHLHFVFVCQQNIVSCLISMEVRSTPFSLPPSFPLFFPSQGEKELQVSLFQALVLLLFNSADKLSFTHIREVTCITKHIPVHVHGVASSRSPPARSVHVQSCTFCCCQREIVPIMLTD